MLLSLFDFVSFLFQRGGFVFFSPFPFFGQFEGESIMFRCAVHPNTVESVVHCLVHLSCIFVADFFLRFAFKSLAGIHCIIGESAWRESCLLP